MAFTDQTTGEIVNGIKKVRYNHDAMIDLIVAEPTISQNELASIFERTPAWISTIINSDTFQARLEERKAALVDPVIQLTIKDRLSAVAARSLERILDKLESPLPKTDDFLIKSAQLASQALGYGARTPSDGGTNIAVIVQVPGKAPSSTEWVENHTPGALS